jgi:hypothetical protein
MGIFGKNQNSQNGDEKLEDVLTSEEERNKMGFFRSWLNIGRDAAMGGIKVGDNLVNGIFDSINKNNEYKAQIAIAEAEKEARAKYGDSGADYEAAIAKARQEAYEQFQSEAALKKAQEEAEKQAAEAQKQIEEAEQQGHTVEEWSWEVSEDGLSGKWVLKTTS